jgi:hypothetical protein
MIYLISSLVLALLSLLLWLQRAPVGTKSVLFGAHCFFLHPWFVAYAWWKLYGFPFDPRLWVAFFVHDLGYWGCPNMDGPEGELHPYWGANIMHRLFDKKGKSWSVDDADEDDNTWYNFTLYHSRFLAKKNNAQYSQLCVADKYSFCFTPSWLYLPMVRATGEIKEYMKDADLKYKTMQIKTNGQKVWHKSVSDYLKAWSLEHRIIKQDNWTPDQKKAKDESGVWR